MKPFPSVTLLSLFVVVVMICGCSKDDKGTNNTNEPQLADTVWVSSVSATANEQTKVDITIRNSTSIASLEVPLRLAGNDFTIDSGSYVGGSFENAYLKSAVIDPGNKTVYFIAAHSGSGTTPAGTSHLASLFVTLGANAANQVISVDSAFIPVGGNVYHVVAYATPNVTQILPAFVPGQITVAP